MKPALVLLFLMLLPISGCEKNKEALADNNTIETL
jgi:hypothetical protein